MPAIQLIAVKRHKYNSRWNEVGETFFAKNKSDALVLVAIKKAEYHLPEIKVAAPPKKEKAAAAKKKKTSTKKTTSKKTTSTKKAATKTKDMKAAEEAKPTFLGVPDDIKDPVIEDEDPEKVDEQDEEKTSQKGTYQRSDLRAKK